MPRGRVKWLWRREGQFIMIVPGNHALVLVAALSGKRERESIEGDGG